MICIFIKISSVINLLKSHRSLYYSKKCITTIKSHLFIPITKLFTGSTNLFPRPKVIVRIYKMSPVLLYNSQGRINVSRGPWHIISAGPRDPLLPQRHFKYWIQKDSKIRLYFVNWKVARVYFDRHYHSTYPVTPLNIISIPYLLDWAPPPNERRIWDHIFLKSAAPEWAPH
jgi:hypothetical protein